MQKPELMSHTRIDTSLLAESKKSPEFMNATLLTSCSCPSSVLNTVNVYMLHNLIVMSTPHDARVDPLGENATQLTMPEWPFRVLSCSPYS